MKTVHLRVHPSDSNSLLVDFLARRLNLSGRKAKGLLDSRQVFVNQSRVWMARHVLHGHDEVDAMLLDEPTTAKVRIPILFEDAHYLVADKPAGLLSNEGQSVERLVRAATGQDHILAVHRLDRNTSGCMLLARHREAFDRMVELFRQDRVHKTYHAIVSGTFSFDRRSIRQPLEGREAVTHYMSLDSRRGASHLQITIETGRTHQIRKHLAGLGHPVLGDSQYGVDMTFSPGMLPVQRQMLHASDLRFPHPYTSKDTRVASPLPPDFCQCLRSLRLT